MAAETLAIVDGLNVTDREMRFMIENDDCLSIVGMNYK